MSGRSFGYARVSADGSDRKGLGCIRQLRESSSQVDGSVVIDFHHCRFQELSGKRIKQSNLVRAISFQVGKSCHATVVLYENGDDTGICGAQQQNLAIEVGRRLRARDKIDELTVEGIHKGL